MPLCFAGLSVFAAVAVVNKLAMERARNAGKRWTNGELLEIGGNQWKITVRKCIYNTEANAAIVRSGGYCAHGRV